MSSCQEWQGTVNPSREHAINNNNRRHESLDAFCFALTCHRHMVKQSGYGSTL